MGPAIRRWSLPAAKRASVLKSERTEIKAGGSKITLDVDLGRSSFSVDSDRSDGRGQLAWNAASIGLPNGFALLHADVAGVEEYPILTITLAVPNEAVGFSAQIKDRATNRYPEARLHVHGRDSMRIGRALSAGSWTPDATISVPETFRALRTITLRVPLAYRANSELIARRVFTVSLNFTQPHNAAPPQSKVSDPIFAETYARAVANAKDVPSFQVPLRQRPLLEKNSVSRAAAAFVDTLSIDTTTYQWIDPQAPYIKLFVRHDGLYRLTAQDLDSVFDLRSHNWRADNIRLLNRGVEVPIWVEANGDGSIAAVEFYGEHLRGFSGEYYNVATDLNPYWLTTSAKAGGAPLRYRSKTIATSPASSITTGTVTLHHEHDFFYYDGDKGVDEPSTVQRTEYVPGERFEWYEFRGPFVDLQHPNDTMSVLDTFYISKPSNVAPNDVVRFHFYARGMSWDITSPNQVLHHMIVRVNGQYLAESKFIDFSDDSLFAILPLSALNDGPNVVQVLSGGDPNHPDKFYLDHYTVSIPSALAPSRDTGVAKGQWDFTVQTPEVAPFALSLRGTPARVYNLSDTTVLSGPAFVDSSSARLSRYVASSDGAYLHPDQVQAWNAGGGGTWRILSDSNQTDYIVITHPLFSHAAAELALRRGGLHPMVVTTDEVFNAFDNGSDEPEAIRRFLRYAYYRYRGTPVSFVTLLGDATWDSKGNLNNTLRADADRTNQRSYVPTFGKPVSDFYFTLVDEGDDLSRIQPRMLIARIPVSSPDEAEAYVQKVVQYEDQAPSDWNRHFLFITGGENEAQNRGLLSEVNSFLQPSTDSTLPHITTPPMNVDATVISRTFYGDLDYTHTGEIQGLIREGVSLVYFSGHGATFATDVALGDPHVLRNAGLYPVLITGSCATGAFAEPNLVTLNESFLRVPDQGMITTFGTTGFGEIDYDYVMSRKMFILMRDHALSLDTAKPNQINLTQLFTLSKLYASDESGIGVGWPGLNSRLQYNILGDAALGFIYRPQPELAVHAADLSAWKGATRKSIFNIGDSIVIQALVHNYGYAAERPVVIRFRDIGPDNLTVTRYDTLSFLNDSARVASALLLSSTSVGQHTIVVTIDPDNQFPETHEEDNEASIQILVNSLSVAPFFPYEGARGMCDVDEQRVRFMVLLPEDANAARDRVQIEVDTDRTFSTPYRLDSLAGASYLRDFVLPISALSARSVSGVYWWRSRIARSSGDLSPWEYSSFNVLPSTHAELSYSSRDQLASTIRAGLVVNAAGSLVMPQEDSVRFDVVSHGGHDPGVTDFHSVGIIFVNDRAAYQTFTGDLTDGYSVVTIRDDGTGLDTAYEFAASPWWLGEDSAYNATLRLRFDSVIKSIPTGKRVIVMTNGQPVHPQFSADSLVLADLQSLGSSNGFRSLDYFGSYVLIGRKGSAPGTAREVYKSNGQGPAELLDTIVTIGTSGVAETPPTATATKYLSFRWTGSKLPPGSDIAFTILGTLRGSGGIEPAATFLASRDTSFDLTGVDPLRYERIAVRAEFTRTSSSTESPQLSQFEIQYDPAPEFDIVEDSILTTPSSVSEGNWVVSRYTIRNLTCIHGSNVLTELVRSNGSRFDTVGRHIITTIPGHSTVTIQDSLSTYGQQGLVILTATVNPDEVQNEQLQFNNSVTGRYRVARDTAKPVTEILIDDRHLPSYGYASSRSTITINLYSNSPIRQQDTASITARIFNESDSTLNVVYLGVGNQPGYNVEFTPLSSGPIQAVLRITRSTPFPPGRYNVTAYAHDASGNAADTMTQTFVVTNVNGLDHVMNYPNPFKDQTDFTYVLRSDAPADVKVIVYTIAGRKLRTLTPTVSKAGLNRISWDGRDEDGNEVANGTYLYRVTIHGRNADGTELSDGVTEKAVRSR